MKNKFSNEWMSAMMYRAIRTVAQTALSMLTVGMGLFDVDWLQVLSISIVAGIISVLTSIVTGLPEARTDGVLVVNPNYEDEEDKSIVMGVKFDKTVTPEVAENMIKRGTVNLEVHKLS